ncbi:MAG: F-box protein [Parachlamydiaceae bacterium]
MSLTVSESVVSSYSSKNINATKQDPIQIIPDGLVLEVFSYLNIDGIGACRRVSEAWKKLANNPILLKRVYYREIAFGIDKWAEYFGENAVKDEDKEEEFSSCPLKAFIQDCIKFKRIFPRKRTRDCLMLVWLPKTLNGGLTLNTVIELAKKYLPPSYSANESIKADIIRHLGDQSIAKSQWVVMTQDLLPGTIGANGNEQKKQVLRHIFEQRLIGYKIPPILPATVCILSRYIESNAGSDKPLFVKGLEIYTRCTPFMLMNRDSFPGALLEPLMPLVDCSRSDDLKLKFATSEPFMDVGLALLREF